MNIVSYEQIAFWDKSFPVLMSSKSRLTKEVTLKEYFWQWNGFDVHIDHYYNENPKAKIILLHGLGMNGRMNSFFAVPLWKLGYEIISPDLPLFGLTKGNTKELLVDDWILMIKDLIEQESDVDGTPIYLFGISTSGIIAFQVATLTKVAGVIATHLLDQSKLNVRIKVAKNKATGLISLPLSSLFSTFEPDVYLPLSTLMSPKFMLSNESLCFNISKDQYSVRTDINLRFYNSILKNKPYVEPENFKNCPLLLIHPELDNWVKLESSLLFYEKLKCYKSREIIKGAGHLPIEEQAISQIGESIETFIQSTLKWINIQ